MIPLVLAAQQGLWLGTGVKVESYYSGLSTSMVVVQYGTPLSSMETLTRTGEGDSRISSFCKYPYTINMLPLWAYRVSFGDFVILVHCNHHPKL